MGLRPAHCYRSLRDRAFTRVAITVHQKNFVGAAPALRIKQFNMGNPAKEYSHILDLCSAQAMQVRDNAIESARIAINRYVQGNLGKENYFMRIRVYPFHIMRENKQAQGAGADRVSQGMAHSFGKAIGRSVRVKKGQVLASVLVDEAGVETAKEGLLRASSKLPCKVSVKIHTDVKSIGTRPRAAKIREAEEKEAEEEAREKEEKVEKKGEKEEKAEAKEEVEKKGEEKPEEKKEEGKEGAKGEAKEEKPAKEEKK